MKSLRLAGTSLLTAVLLSGCAVTSGPITQEQAQLALSSVETPSALINFELEENETTDGESDGYTESYDASSICNSVAEIGQLTYQAGHGLGNKQSLPPELRDFDVREGIVFEDTFGDDEEEYVSFYLTLLSFDSADSAEAFASSLKEAVEPCGDVQGSIEQRTTIKFESLDGPNDFSHRVRSIFEVFGITLVGEQFDFLVQNGAVIGLVHTSASENGLSESGLSTSDVDEIALGLLDQAFEGIK